MPVGNAGSDVQVQGQCLNCSAITSRQDCCRNWGKQLGLTETAQVVGINNQRQ